MRTGWDWLVVVAAYLGYAFLYVGLLLHTSSQDRNKVLRKYSYPHAFLLLAGLLPFYFIPVFLGTVRQAALMLASGLAVLGCWEILLQIRRRVGRSRKREGAEWPAHPFLQTCRQPNPARGINSRGFRGADIEQPKSPGTYRIFLQGDSAFENEWNPYQESLAGVLESRLKGRCAAAIEVQNAAVAWHSTQHALIDYLFRLQEFKPDLVILCHAMNDLYRGFSAPGVALPGASYQSDYSHFWAVLAPIIQEHETGRPWEVPLKMGKLARQYLYSDWRPQPWGGSFLEYFCGPALRETEFTEFPSIGAFERNLRSIVEIYRLKGSDVILATQPSLYKDNMTRAELRRIGIPQRYVRVGNQIASIATMKRGMEAYNAVTRRVATDLQCGFIDLDLLVPKSIDHFANDVHYTVLSNRLIGEALAKLLISRKYVSAPEQAGVTSR